MSNVGGVAAFQDERIRALLEDRPLLSAGERISKAIGYLRESGNYEVFIRNGRTVSCLTVRDIISIANPTGMKLDSLSYSVPSMEQSSTVSEAARVMFDYRLRALPCGVVGDKVSVISAPKIMLAMNGMASPHNTASEIMSSNPVTIQSSDTVLKAKNIMIRRSFDYLPVMKDTKLVGILTSSNLLLNLLPEERPSELRGDNLRTRFDYPISRIADDNIVEVEPSSKFAQVLEKMIRNSSSYALVRLWEEVQGIITLRDILKPLVKRKEEKMPYYIVGLPNDPFEAEAAKMKLERLGASLIRAFPTIREVRAIVKTKEISGGRRRYEVSFNLYLARGMHAYTEGGYDLAEVFDRVRPKLKKLLTTKQSKVTRSAGRSVRRGESPIS